MEIGINLLGSIDIKTQTETLKRLGVRHTFFSSEFGKFDEAVAACRELGITVDTLHAPFDGINNMWRFGFAGKRMLRRLLTAVDRCAENGIPVVIVHLSSGDPMPRINRIGRRRYEKLFRYAAKRGVVIALENQRYLENLSYFLDRYKSVGFCWDSGHEYGFTKGIRFMKLYGDRAVATHIHDNRAGVDTDDHLIPYDGRIDLETVAENLGSSTYDGTLMLELTRYPSRESGVSYDELSDEEFLTRAASAAERLLAAALKYR